MSDIIVKNKGCFPSLKYFSLLVPLFLFAVAACLRFWRISSQIIGDDEFHGIRAAFDPLLHILTHFQWADNCIPLTAFYRILIRTVGLSDMGLKAPLLFTGLLAVILCAALLRSSSGVKASTIGMFLAATSPLLIYFSRYARPYMIVVFLSFIMVQALHSWLEEKKRAAVPIYVITVVLAAYFSLPALPGLIAPILWLTGLRYLRRYRSGNTEDPRFPQFPTLFAAGGAVLLGIALWFLPTFRSMKALTQKAGLGIVSPASFPGALNLFSGTGNDTLSFILLVVCGYGIFRLARTKQIFAGSLAAMVVVQAVGLAVVRPHALQAPIVLARYAIVLWPVWVIGISIGLADLHDRLIDGIGPGKITARRAAWGLLPVFMAVLFFLGPLPWIYRYPNNFTNHNDFQAGYDRSRLTHLEARNDLWPVFYDRLCSDPKIETVIEYPLVTPWNNNPYHAYQRRHRKRVLAGRDDQTFIVQLMPIMHPKLRLTNSVDLTDFEAIKRSRASYILVHKDLLAELLHLWKYDKLRTDALKTIARDPGHINQIWYYHPARESAARILPVLHEFFGPPVYEDEWIAAFKIDEI